MKTIIALVGLFLAVVSAEPWIPEPGSSNGWMSKHLGFVENTERNANIINVLFYGDSLFEAFWRGKGKVVFDEYYRPLGTANYGISGDHTEHVLWRIQNGEVTDKLHPAVCVLLIGTNNFNSVEDDDVSIALGIVSNVLELREQLPNTKLLLLGVLPRTNETMTARTSRINEILQTFDNGKTIRFLDMKQYFYNGGDSFNTELYESDLLHLEEAGYRKLAEVMDSLFKEMLASSHH